MKKKACLFQTTLKKAWDEETWVKFIAKHLERMAGNLLRKFTVEDKELLN